MAVMRGRVGKGAVLTGQKSTEKVVIVRVFVSQGLVRTTEEEEGWIW